MELYEKQITIKIPKIDFFFVGMIAVFLTIGAACVNLIQGFSTGDAPFFSIETSFILMGVSTFFFFSRVMEESPLQKSNKLFQEPDDDYETISGSDYYEHGAPGGDVVQLPAIAEPRNENSIGGILNRVDEQHVAGVDENQVLVDTLEAIQKPEPTDDELLQEIKTSLTEALDDEKSGRDNVSELVSEIEEVIKDKKVA